MPRYFFDVDFGDRLSRDRTGMDLRSVDDVLPETSSLLLDLAQSDVSTGNRAIAVDVRDASGAIVYRATMTIALRRL